MTVPDWMVDLSPDDEDEEHDHEHRPMVVVAMPRPAAYVLASLTAFGGLAVFYAAVKFVVNH